jgi:predicted regulator of Ras-like GTPase activity (Roadblock/LC7/MglB family)
MGFREHLESVCQAVDGAVVCSVMGFDGIAIDTYEVETGDVDIQSLLIEYGSILSQVRTAADVMRAGAVSEISISTERLMTVARLVTNEYFMVLAMKPDANYGKARYVLRITAPKVKQEL